MQAKIIFSQFKFTYVLGFVIFSMLITWLSFLILYLSQPEDFWFSAPKKGIMVFALPGEPGLTEVSGDFKIHFHDRQGDFYWFDTSLGYSPYLKNYGPAYNNLENMVPYKLSYICFMTKNKTFE